MQPVEHIPVFRPRPLSWSVSEEIARRFGSANQHSNFGPLVMRLEDELAQSLNVPTEHVVVFSNCTDALAAAAATADVALGAVIPGFSFVATLRAVQVAMPNRFRIEDVNSMSWCLEPTEAGILKEVHVPVAPFGTDPSPILNDFKGRSVVVDAAASLGTFPDLSTLESRHAVCFSLHATKVFGAGEGGFAVFGDALWATRAREWSNFGRNLDGFQASGTNSKMSEVQAAFCLAKLEQREEEMAEWRSAQAIALSVSTEHHLAVQPHGFATVHPYWVVELGSEQERSRVEAELTLRNVGSRRWWSEDLATLIGQAHLPNATSLAGRTLGLPLFCGLTESHGERISEALSAAGI